MKSETPVIIWKRFVVFGTLLLLTLVLIDHLLVSSRFKEEKNKIILSTFQSHKILSNELHTVFHGVQDDFNFFHRKILNVLKLRAGSPDYNSEVRSQIDFFETHPGYFKVRLTDSTGKEIFKIVQKTDHSGFYQSSHRYDLSSQTFYKELNRVKDNEYYFSSMEANIINGVTESPVRPTIRVSKRITLPDKSPGLLIFNIDGQRVINLFNSSLHKNANTREVALVDNEGFYVASYPRLPDLEYTLTKASLKKKAPRLFETVDKAHNLQGTVNTPKEIIVYSHLLLPNTDERWFLISRIKNISWKDVIYRERLTWIFWELFCLVLILTWLWRDEHKRHKDEVVKVLLKERSEFIQNVSHQLKTPLAIMNNSLEKKVPTTSDWVELKKEMYYLIKVVEDMLLLAQVDSFHKIPLKDEDILELVNDAVDLIALKAKEREVSIRFNVDKKLLTSPHRLEKPVMYELLKSALVNLIDNAVDFSPIGETVDVYVAVVEARIIIQVKDNGPGVAVDFIPQLFERFTRQESGGRKGTGLGLSIAKKIIELHNGEILLVKNEKGATFEVRL